MRIELDPNIQTDSAIMVLHNLLQERTPQQSISHKAMPDYETHEAFVITKHTRLLYGQNPMLHGI